MAGIVDLNTVTAVGARPQTMRVVLRNRSTSGGIVEFDVMPTLSESGSANYRMTDASQSPGGFAVYTHSTLRQFQLADVRLIARTQDEAINKLRIQNLLRAWTKPYFGKGNSTSTSGLPPDVLELSAYGSGNISRVPVVLLSYTIDYPNDTDYIYVSRESGDFTGVDDPVVESTAVPISSIVSLTLQEVRSMTELNNFDLERYKTGDLVEWR